MPAMTAEAAATICALPHRVELLRREGTVIGDGWLRPGAQGDVAFIERCWAPALRGTGADDAGWDWRAKLDDLFAPVDVEHVVLIHAEEVQGTLVTTLPDHLGPTVGEGPPWLYVEYVATAPWNRPGAVGGQRFKGVGPLLVRHAVLRSITRGRDGRIALHSVAKAVAFYERLGLTCRGPDPHADMLEYFEGDALWAQRFLNAVGASR